MENARLPIVDSLTAGTVRRFVTAERKARRPGRSATRTKVPDISRYHTIYDFVGQQSDLVLYALWYPQPVETYMYQCISDVVRRPQLVDEPCSRIQY